MRDYARRHHIRVRDFVETHSSAMRAAQKEQLLNVINSLRKGDRVVVSELSRPGRSLGQILQIVERLIHQHVGLIAIKEGIVFTDTYTMQTKAMISLFGLFVEVERDLIAERTKEGLAAARAKGKNSVAPKAH